MKKELLVCLVLLKKENVVISFEEGDGIVKFTAGGGAAPDVYLVFLHKNRKKADTYHILISMLFGIL